MTPEQEQFTYGLYFRSTSTPTTRSTDPREKPECPLHYELSLQQLLRPPCAPTFRVRDGRRLIGF